MIQLLGLSTNILSAYIDPGTGSMIFATLMGIFSLTGYFFKGLWLKIRFAVTGGKGAESNDDTIPFVIFSDDKRYWSVFEPICRELDLQEFETVYMTASPDDPALRNQYKHVHAIFIGKGNKAFVKLNLLKAIIVLSTTPGLDVYQWKRSKDVKYYIHIPHMPGELTTYRMFGIDYYDAILLSGKYQIDDVRSLEELRELPEKECTIIGIPYLDEMVKRLEKSIVSEHEFTVLVAPSWGSNSLLNRFGDKFIDQLIATGYHIVVRPHPQSFTSEKVLIDRLMKKYPDLEWNRDVDNFDVLNRSDIMISDFSGVILDFALVFDKPVICAYTDFDKSQYDAWWLDSPIWTATAIPRLGPILKESNLSKLKKLIDDTVKSQKFKTNLNDLRTETWSNRSCSARKAANYIIEKYKYITTNLPVKIKDTHIEKSLEAVEHKVRANMLYVHTESVVDKKLTQIPNQKMKITKKVVMTVILLIIWISVILVMRNENVKYREREKEHNDLAMMQAAENEAWFALEEHKIQEKTEYWLSRGMLIPTSFPKPNAYGRGTSMIGGEARNYYRNGEPYYKYDESIDYTDMVIRVIVDPETEEIDVEWVK